ncbi:leucyl/phenylalanyl-tRNA--protein transferase [Flavobacterium sp. Fl-77]|uniref:Leucyl/phenylalanyl-tRNA--protein transferase n=1 Tax=Flavobacterium flavipigmentatum TaxID=2893884 RepID=A0AAJ2VZ31_9FLAO|nr:MULTISPECIES: leucyl/phenylalanyl-tRNA--protein transferase [unclassified Flavobacterium]MDX6183488.1 leucyl/phenylalanyl-tRNA--protein transferase [Flavobacterium sp. Fl-33]MDX6187110.1 leucyl/phenylalanyl-tRNA--protein transferase [Flavobacterium sp. Fl-77]UFH40160.1 leucyl/phenylalanyl-tRNA--protein transferase [Flavobacterium sp. F-70]
MHYIFEELFFPPVSEADEDGILAVGGDLSPARLELAYKNGIFPWFNEGEPILWWAPDPRMVLFFDELIVSKSMRKILKSNQFKVTFNQNFAAVISNCQKIKRDGQNGTWISNKMIDAYCQLNVQGLAKSVEVWQDDVLVGGLYGIDLGVVFCGESMFSKVSNASKVAFIALVEHLKKKNYKLLDCQVYNPHLESLGCREIEREEFMSILENKKAF